MSNKIITARFTRNNVAAIGLVPVIDIYELNPTTPTSNPQVVTQGILVEIGAGWYRYDFVTYNPKNSYVFTIDGGSTLTAPERFQYGGNESYADDVAPAVWDETATLHTSVGTTGLLLSQINADTTTIAVNQVTILSLLNLLLKYERNRTKIDTVNATLTVYDDDCTTILQVFNLRDHLGLPSVQEVCERVPTTCP